MAKVFLEVGPGENHLCMTPIDGRRECRGCGHIFRGLILAHNVDAEEASEVTPHLAPQPCPACGATINDPWFMPASLDDWLIMIDQTVASCEDDRDRIGAVFVASACEAMLREIIELSLQKQNVSANLITYLLDKARGREELCKLYDAIATSHRSVLEAAELLPWLDEWRRLAQARNKYAHGKQASEGLATAIHVVTRQMDEAFVSLRNAALRG